MWAPLGRWWRAQPCAVPRSTISREAELNVEPGPPLRLQFAEMRISIAGRIGWALRLARLVWRHRAHVGAVAVILATSLRRVIKR